MNPSTAITQRIQRFSLKDYAQMLTSKPQRAAEEQAERVLAELDKAQESSAAPSRIIWRRRKTSSQALYLWWYAISLKNPALSPPKCSKMMLP
ncbi:MAG: hypothetical protein H9535_02485 [Ignavibacteria bacterium]|nr:hypothetical protein [Ignavibacteria bacterium]